MSMFLDVVGYLAAILTTLSFLPQALMTIRTRDTSSLSLSMYSMFTVGVCCWLIYGMSIGDSAITFANLITLLLASPILAFKVIHTWRGGELGDPEGLPLIAEDGVSGHTHAHGQGSAGSKG